MLSRLICPLLACFSCTLLAKPLQDVDDQTLQTDLGDLRLPSTSNASLSSAAGTGSNDMSVKCDGNKYGFKPDIHDCTTALQRQAEGSERIRFGQRNSTSEDYFFHLPYRLMGDEALCYLQPVLINGAEFGYATLRQIRNAASELVLQCASSAEQGGIATNIGGDNKLALILSTYSPDIECRGNFPTWKSPGSCWNLVAAMPASEEMRVFGPEADPDVQVVVPHILESDDKKCLGRIWYTKKESDIASWYSIWEALTAVYAVCVRNQKVGTIRGLGENHNLFLTMTPRVGPVGNISLNLMTDTGEDPGISDF